MAGLIKGDLSERLDDCILRIIKAKTGRISPIRMRALMYALRQVRNEIRQIAMYDIVMRSQVR